MSISSTIQTGDMEEPLPTAILELQQIALGMFLVWDTLGEGYSSQKLAESSILADWARKHGLKMREAVKALVFAKERFTEEPFCHFIMSRDFSAEGWVHLIIFNPKDNRDVTHQIERLLEARPFSEGK